MNEQMRGNYVFLRGHVSTRPCLSHRSRGEEYYRFLLEVSRLSGAVDTLPVIARASLLDELEVGGGDALAVTGEVRSFNNRSGTGPKLVITVFAKTLCFEDGPDENTVELTGTLCKEPVHRVTPMGREIADLMLAVNRRCGRSDYLPCIAWGAGARTAAGWHTGDALRMQGRFQSRAYTKNIDGQAVEKVAYEISVIRLELL
ncbi:MAG: single-stranded DNA-binding protein [Oscillospiraceae bacterium]|nr:single-stranded DNA-binding protein [Oscillospiraceae bacterium]